MKKLFYFIIISLAILNSCSKSINMETKNKFVNPYNYVGQQHNNVLMLLNADKKLNLQNFEQHWENIRPQIASNLNLDLKKVVNYNDAKKQYSFINKKKSTELPNISDYAIELYNSDSINLLQENYLLQLDTLIRNNFGSSNFSELINNFEYAVNNDSQLNDEQKSLIFITSAVSNYSESFWVDALTDPKNLYYSPDSMFPWLIVGCDAVGAIAGALLTGGDPWGAVALGGFCSGIAWNLSR